MYRFLIRPVFFLFDPERVHHFTFALLKFLSVLPGVKSLWKTLFDYKSDSLEREYFGLKFKNPVGLAAGFDKDARLIDELACFGFGFIEIGTITPVGQPGNDRPRLFRLPKDKAIINRMGFNNEGLEAAVRRLKTRKSGVLVGGNIGKNKITPNEEAVRDYELTFEGLFPYVDYFVVNVSSPNTPNLRALQEKEPLTQLLLRLQERNRQREKRKPILLKIAPDLTDEQLGDIVEIVGKVNLDGLIATNTTISRENLSTSRKRVDVIGAGGISGAPLAKRSTEILKFLRTRLGPEFPIISVGGIMSPKDAVDKMKAGASLIQVYTGFVYQGPGFVTAINKAIDRFSNS
ncbi:quinone-dependent dihydroorotate dehydrogenase [Fulvivirga sp. M361]|uniref:quinone-dependent dihydroorotate dehydrogenase n=1 Tax=Fulvivirga sp. M361 TaxID=2594266 RepID=UPI0011799F62|nr:quinone-dependent dihydroorotate dehydrogenase [Fulvivirga sp. M361]TRX47992.1 quinone-dependent dihydroorotate dehydrogenase [Fulvivirga sp. M361]